MSALARKALGWINPNQSLALLHLRQRRFPVKLWRRLHFKLTSQQNMSECCFTLFRCSQISTCRKARTCLQCSLTVVELVFVLFGVCSSTRLSFGVCSPNTYDLAFVRQHSQPCSVVTSQVDPTRRRWACSRRKARDRECGPSTRRTSTASWCPITTSLGSSTSLLR